MVALVKNVDSNQHTNVILIMHVIFNTLNFFSRTDSYLNLTHSHMNT